MSRYIDIDDVANAIYHHFPSVRTMADARGVIEEAPTIDIVRCKECASYCGDGNKCLWGLLTGDMGYCHHGYRGGDCITKQTEREGE